MLDGADVVEDNGEVELSGLVVSATGIYMLLLVGVEFPVGWSFQLEWHGRLLHGEVDYCQARGRKFLLGLELQRHPLPLTPPN